MEKPDHDRTCRCDVCAEYWHRQQVEPDRDPDDNKHMPKETDKEKFIEFIERGKMLDDMKHVEPDRYDPKSRYYDAGGVEVLEIIRAKLTPEQYQGFCLGNAIKYTCRANHKGDYDRDLEKAEFYTREAR